jgi:hypothetical protein
MLLVWGCFALFDLGFVPLGRGMDMKTTALNLLVACVLCFRMLPGETACCQGLLPLPGFGQLGAATANNYFEFFRGSV